MDLGICRAYNEILHGTIKLKKLFNGYHSADAVQFATSLKSKVLAHIPSSFQSLNFANAYFSSVTAPSRRRRTQNWTSDRRMTGMCLNNSCERNSIGLGMERKKYRKRKINKIFRQLAAKAEDHQQQREICL